MIVRIIGNNLAGGARKYCYILNTALHQKKNKTITFIPKAPIEDPLSDEDKVAPLLYRNTINPIKIVYFLSKYKSKIRYIHFHLRNVTLIFAPIAILLKIPYVVTIHAPMSENNNLKQRMLHQLHCKLLSNSELTIFISGYILGKYQNELETTNKIVVIHNGSTAPTDTISHRDEQGTSNPEKLKNEEISICIVGELSERKGIRKYHETLNLLCAKINNKRSNIKLIFNFYGKGPLQKVVEDLSEKYDSDPIKVRSHGYVTETATIFQNNDIHLILSENEPFGRVITEAMSYGVPTICLSAGAFPEIVEHNQDGVLCDSIDDISNQILRLASQTDTLAELSQKSARNFFLKFSSEISTEKTIQAIERVIPNA